MRHIHFNSLYLIQAREIRAWGKSSRNERYLLRIRKKQGYTLHIWVHWDT